MNTELMCFDSYVFSHKTSPPDFLRSLPHHVRPHVVYAALDDLFDDGIKIAGDQLSGQERSPKRPTALSTW